MDLSKLVVEEIPKEHIRKHSEFVVDSVPEWKVSVERRLQIDLQKLREGARFFFVKMPPGSSTGEKSEPVAAFRIAPNRSLGEKVKALFSKRAFRSLFEYTTPNLGITLHPAVRTKAKGRKGKGLGSGRLAIHVISLAEGVAQEMGITKLHVVVDYDNSHWRTNLQRERKGWGGYKLNRVLTLRIQAAQKARSIMRGIRPGKVNYFPSVVLTKRLGKK